MNALIRSTSLLALLLLPLLAPAQETTDDDHTRRVLHVCSACHGEGGNSTAAGFPRLAGQPSDYLIAQLRAFRSQQRSERDPRAYMWGVSALLDDQTIASLADYYAAQTPGPGRLGDAALVRKGQQIFLDGLPAKGVPACRSCHGDQAEGTTVFPRLAGQHAAYVYAQLRTFGTRLRPHGTVMAGVIRNMSQDEMHAVAEYVQSR